jgi:hypothetical protein
MLSGALSRSPNSRISAPYFRIGKYQGKYLGEVRGDLLGRDLMPAAPSRHRCIVPLGRCSLALDDDRRPLVPASKSHVVNALIRDLAGNCDLASSFSHDGRRTSMRSLEPRRYGSSTRMFCACAPPHPHPAASKYPCSSNSSSLANSSHRLAMSSSPPCQCEVRHLSRAI